MIAQKWVRNSVWNFLGLTIPMFFALFAIPALLRGLGAERFGVLTLAWTMIGYSSLFDLGLGRALTKLVSEKSPAAGSAAGQNLSSTVSTALLLMSILGCIGAALLAAGAEYLGAILVRTPGTLQHEMIFCLQLVAASIPIVVLTACFRGLVEAFQHFAWLNVVRTCMGILTFLAPVACLQLGWSVPGMVFSLALVRLASLAAHVALCQKLTPFLLGGFHCRLSQAAPLFRFGGWITISNVISPLMVSLDRFLLGALVSVASVAYYATPFEVVTKLQVVPSSVTASLFPVFSALSSQRESARDLYARAVRLILVLLAPIGAVMIVLAKPGLTLWLGPEFAGASYRTMQWLVVGVVTNAAAYVPSAFLQAVGRPDVNAKFHILEFPFYLAAAYSLIRLYGIEGAAIAWVARVSLDAGLLFWVASRQLTPRPPAMWEIANSAQPSTRLS